jgi:hypothetical protein
MWDWYNRPGQRGRPQTRTVFLLVVLGSFAVGGLFILLYTLIAPFVFLRVPG